MLAVATFALASTLGGPAIGSHHHASDLVGRMNANEMPAPAFGRASVLAALEAMRAGQPVVVTDDEDRENEGDFIMAGQYATQETIAFIVRYSSGVICCSARRARAPPSSARDHSHRRRVAPLVGRCRTRG